MCSGAACTGYGHWLTDLHGLSQETLQKNGHAAGVFLQWLGDRASLKSLRTLTVADTDAFLRPAQPGVEKSDPMRSGELSAQLCVSSMRRDSLSGTSRSQ